MFILIKQSATTGHFTFVALCFPLCDAQLRPILIPITYTLNLKKILQKFFSCVLFSTFCECNFFRKRYKKRVKIISSSFFYRNLIERNKCIEKKRDGGRELMYVSHAR